MLEVKNLTKVYKPKKGVPVLAVDHISLKFPDKGMVFLLGKSGSGKSTMLNLLGGLDRYDDGEIIIKDVSSKSFKQSHFDSYRNTYLGFIFQEYNILEEFNVGANIALALELQGRKATDEEINNILKQVDLEGYGNRRPNELSGGQKQRVAIARALVKNPEIIMADEPTGALDSVTGRQVLDTLKKLSEEKLVIVVSHDREFAENYADRIIELADGHVISDVEYFGDSQEAKEEKMLSFTEDAVLVAPEYHLTEEDRLAINNWLDQRKGGKLVAGDKKTVVTREARPTDESKIISNFSNPFKLIKSKLPMKNAFKIGASSLKHKKFRLVITILLSCISFGLFGLADTFGCYDNINTCTRSILDSNVNYASFSKEFLEKQDWGEYYSGGYNLSDKDIEELEKRTGLKLSKCYDPGWEDMFDSQYDTTKKFTETSFHIYTPNFGGLATIDEALLKNMGATLVAGRLPDGKKDEMAITTYLAQTFIIGGYRANASDKTFEEIKAPEDMVGKTLRYGEKEFLVTGVIDVHFDLDRYKDLVVEKKGQTSGEQILEYALYSELRYAREYSLLTYALVGDGYIEELTKDHIDTIGTPNGWVDMYLPGGNDDYYFNTQNLGTFEKYKDSVVWFDSGKTNLGDQEVILGEESIRFLMGLINQSDKSIEEFIKENPALIGTIVSYSEDHVFSEKEYKIVGYVPSSQKKMDIMILNDKNVSYFCNDVSRYEDCYYSLAVGAMPENYSDVKKVVSLSEEKGEIRYSLNNSVTFELDGMNEVFEILSKVFLGIGIGFAVFASIMLANFIASSISYKKQEIGILRAIGARGSDVFRIFFSESFIIAMINFILSAIGTGVVTALINSVIRTQAGILVTVLSFGIRQIALLLLISVGVAALASFVPVWKIARKRPIDAIRKR